jgi:hypothetical protein
LENIWLNNGGKAKRFCISGSNWKHIHHSNITGERLSIGYKYRLPEMFVIKQG